MRSNEHHARAPRAAYSVAYLFIVFLLAGGWMAAGAGEAKLHVGGAWARASIGNLDRSAAYFEIANHGSAPDRLVGMKSEVSDKLEMHATVMDGDVMRMRAITDGVEVPAGGTVAFAPGGLHVMLIGLKEPLKEGMGFPLTLVFEKAGELRVDVAVRKGAPDRGHGHH